MTTLHLIRHGETDWNATGRIQGQMQSQLTDLGKQQARSLQSELLGFNFDRVFSSSSIRARQTADLALEHIEQPFTYLDSLREIYLAQWEGHLYKEIEARDPQGMHAFRHQPHLFDVEGAETFFDLQKRALAAIGDIIAQCPGQEIAIVSHGAWIKSALCHYEGRAMSEFWEPPRMHNCCHSIIKFPYDGSEAQIIRYADIDQVF